MTVQGTDDLTKDPKLSEKFIQLRKDKVFYGTINQIEKDNHYYNVSIDLTSKTTEEIDDLISQNELPNTNYNFMMTIKTPSLTLLGHKNDIFKFERIKKLESHFNTYEGSLSIITHRQYDGGLYFKDKKMFFKVTKASTEELEHFKNMMNGYIEKLEQHIHFNEKLTLPTPKRKFNKHIGVRYSQYNVGTGNCTYVNIGGLSKGFFNLGFSKDDTSKSYKYTGFARHKPDWVIISNLNKDYYCAALRYGREHIFNAKWIIPKISKYNINIIRLLFSIINAGGEIYLLKYKANSSVCSFIKDKIKMEVYYTTDYSMNENGLCLYIENDEKFISFGNADYNFMTKNLISQTFDYIVVPYMGAKMKTKIHLTTEEERDYKIKEVSYNPGALNNVYRKGFNIYRTDLSGSFHCKI